LFTRVHHFVHQGKNFFKLSTLQSAYPMLAIEFSNSFIMSTDLPPFVGWTCGGLANWLWRFSTFLRYKV